MLTPDNPVCTAETLKVFCPRSVQPEEVCCRMLWRRKSPRVALCSEAQSQGADTVLAAGISARAGMPHRVESSSALLRGFELRPAAETKSISRWQSGRLNWANAARFQCKLLRISSSTGGRGRVGDEDRTRWIRCGVSTGAVRATSQAHTAKAYGGYTAL